MTEQGMHEELREQDAGGDSGAESGIDVVLVTGLSGAGRGTAAKVLEDLGWYVADNLPPELIAQMVDLGLAAGSRITQLAVVMDVRSRGFTGDLDWVRKRSGHPQHHAAGVVPGGLRRHPGAPLRAEPAQSSAAGQPDSRRRHRRGTRRCWRRCAPWPTW